MMQRKNKPITIDINTNNRPVSLQMLLSALAIQHTPSIPIRGKVRYTINQKGQVSITGKVLS